MSPSCCATGSTKLLNRPRPSSSARRCHPTCRSRRWFGAKDQTLQSSHIAYMARLGGERDMLLAEVEVKTDRHDQPLAAAAVDILGG